VDTSEQTAVETTKQVTRRRRSVEEKRRIVEETLESGASVARIARRHAVNANQVFYWRKKYREGRLGKNQSSKLLPVTLSDISWGKSGRASSLAGSGLRIGEALGLELGKHISNDGRTFYVRQSVWAGLTQKPKTASAVRDLDLCPALATMLTAFIGGRTSGFLFQNASGRPFAQSNVLRRNLHPILSALGVPKAGFHSFRRFRATHLSKSRVPESLAKFWMGHAEVNQSEEYVKMFDEVAYRTEVADSIGLGFEIAPEEPIVRNVRKKSVKVEVGVAA